MFFIFELNNKISSVYNLMNLWGALWSKGYPIEYPLQWFFCQNPLMGVLDNFFPTGTYTGIGTSVSSLKHVMKSTTKKSLNNKYF